MLSYFEGENYWKIGKGKEKLLNAYFIAEAAYVKLWNIKFNETNKSSIFQKIVIFVIWTCSMQRNSQPKEIWCKQLAHKEERSIWSGYLIA